MEKKEEDEGSTTFLGPQLGEEGDHGIEIILSDTVLEDLGQLARGGGGSEMVSGGGGGEREEGF